jgi:hypothetical protein
MLPKQFMMPENLTNKMIENAIRLFERTLTKPQFKAVKTVIR